MIIYEITATVGSGGLAEEYEKYMLERHIPELLETGFFSGAKLTRAGANRYRIQYEAPDRKALDEYLATEATRLRADFLAHFPADVEVSRENWEVLQIWKKE